MLTANTAVAAEYYVNQASSATTQDGSAAFPFHTIAQASAVMVAGFVIKGNTPRTVLIRGVGPTLADFGVNGTLGDPLIQVFDAGQTKIAENDNWWGPLRTTFPLLGAFNLTSGSKDAALQLTLEPGSYTVQVSGVADDTGEALVEIYAIQ